MLVGDPGCRGPREFLPWFLQAEGWHLYSLVVSGREEEEEEEERKLQVTGKEMESESW